MADRSAIDDVESILARHSAELDAAMRAAVPPLERCGLHGMLGYHLGWLDRDGSPSSASAGKRLRPALVLLAVEAAGGDPTSAIPAAAAVELLHNFSLIHDDIQDRSAERRHRATVWSIWGAAQAINAGDAMHAIASRTILRCAEAGAAPADTLAAAAALHDCCVRLVEGQYLDLSFEARDDVSSAEYFRMIEGKTAELLATSVEIGAILAQAGERRSIWREFGRQLGLAFQVVDDVLGIWGDPAVTGKQTGDDVVRGKRSLPYLLAREQLPEDARRRLDEIYAATSRDRDAVAEALALIDRSGARRLAEDQAAASLNQALGALDRAGARSPGREKLSALARYVVTRDR